MENETVYSEDQQVTALSEMVRSEIDVQISTAKKYPRSLQKFRQDAMSMATVDAETASSCFYKLRRQGKNGQASIIEGPSVRLAEIIASSWGNLRFGARIVAEDEKTVTAQGVAHDLEKNVSNTIEVSRRITTKNGKRYSDDMIQVTKNAACSIALRNAIFKTIPFTYAKQVYEHAKKTAVGNAKTLTERRQQMIVAFAQMSVTAEQLLDLVEKKSIEDIGLSEIEILIGVFNAIKDGDTTIDEQFGKHDSGTKPEVTMPESIEQPKKEAPKQEETKKVSEKIVQTLQKCIAALNENNELPVGDGMVIDKCSELGIDNITEMTENQAQEFLKELAMELDKNESGEKVA